MKIAFKLLTLLCLLTPSVQADVFVLNTTDESMTYEVTLPNGDTATGEIKPTGGYYPTQTTIAYPDGAVATYKIMSESGESAVQVKSPPNQIMTLAIVNGGMKVLPTSWNVDNGQTHKREMTILNATDQALTFDIIDEKEVRKGNTLAPGESKSYPAKNGFGMGFQHLRFADGQRLEPGASTGSFNVLYWDKRSPGKIQCDDFGHITPPKGQTP